jgi:hypothetical protein
MLECAARVEFRQGKQPDDEHQQRHRWRILRRLRPIEAAFDGSAAVIGALFFVVGWRFFTLRMLATGEKLETRKHLQPAVKTSRHPEGDYCAYTDGSPDSHLTNRNGKRPTVQSFTISAFLRADFRV